MVSPTEVAPTAASTSTATSTSAAASTTAATAMSGATPTSAAAGMTSTAENTIPTPTVASTSPQRLTLSPEPAATVTPSPFPSSTCSPTPSLTPSPSPTAMPRLTSSAPHDTIPGILSFSAERIDTAEGEAIALRWEAWGERATICPRIDEVTVGCRCLFGLPPAGSRVMEPSDIVGAYTGFELIVEARGVRAVRYAPLMVDCPDHFSDWFFDDPPGICPREAQLVSYAAAQRFEHGLLIWIEAQDTYYVLNDGFITPSGRQPIASKLATLQILNGPLDLTPGASAGNRVEEEPPNGFFEPVSGFGLVWRGEVVGIEDVRARLGWAVEPEYGFDTIYQCEMSCGSTWDCYLRGPQGEIFHLYWLLHVGHVWEPVDRDLPGDTNQGLEGR